MQPDRPTIFLFDIDGTLLLTGGAGRRAFARAFDSMLGREEAVEGFSFAGMTDRAIARTGLQAIGAAPTPEAIEQLVSTYLEALDEELEGTRAMRVMPAVVEVVETLRAAPNAAVGLGTGNVRRGAYAKLARAQLHELFAFGGFGCDHETRVELLRVGAQRGAQRLARPLSECRVVVIGDTVHDVRAARGIQAECLGVCTGGATEAELHSAQASVVFADLSQAGVLPFLLSGG